MDDSHILFASDYPFAPELATVATIGGLEDYDGFDRARARVGISRTTPCALFPRLQEA